MFCVWGWVWCLWAASCEVSHRCENCWWCGPWASAGSWRTLILALAAASRMVLFHGLTGNSVAGVHVAKRILLDCLCFLWISFPFIRTRSSLLYFCKMILSLHFFFFTDSVSCSSITFPSGTLVFPKLLIVFQSVIAATKLSQFSCMFAPCVRSPFDFRGNCGMASDCSY